MLKKAFVQLMTIMTVFAAMVSFAMPAHAGDAAAGGKVFQANCAACHAGGRNAVNPAKTLKKEDLEKYGMYSEATIVTQVTGGKGAMPAFGSKLTAEQIGDVASYVLSKADDGWAK
jgi:cytochrome c6